jgi:predicted peroxiredoxin
MVITEKGLLILSQTGPEDPDRAILPLVVASMAKVSRIEVKVFLLGDATRLLTKENIDEVKGDVFPSLRKAYEDLVKEGIEVHVCSRYMKSYGLKKEDLAINVKISSLAKLAELGAENGTLTF